MLLKIHEIRLYDYYTWLSENVMLLVFLKWVKDKRESLPATELVAYFIYEWNGRIFCGEEEKFFLLAETVEFFSSTQVLVQLDISDRAEIWTVMLKKKKGYSAPPKTEWGLVFTICSNCFGYISLQIIAVAKTQTQNLPVTSFQTLAGSKQGSALVIGVCLAIRTALIHPLWSGPIDSNPLVWDYPNTVGLVWACLSQPAGTLGVAVRAVPGNFPRTGESSGFPSFCPPLEYNNRNLFCSKLSSPVLIISPHCMSTRRCAKPHHLLWAGLEEHLVRFEAEGSRHHTSDTRVNPCTLSVVYVYWQNTKNEGKWHLNGLTAS